MDELVLTPVTNFMQFKRKLIEDLSLSKMWMMTKTLGSRVFLPLFVSSWEHPCNLFLQNSLHGKQ